MGLDTTSGWGDWRPSDPSNPFSDQIRTKSHRGKMGRRTLKQTRKYDPTTEQNLLDLGAKEWTQAHADSGYFTYPDHIGLIPERGPSELPEYEFPGSGGGQPQVPAMPPTGGQPQVPAMAPPTGGQPQVPAMPPPTGGQPSLPPVAGVTPMPEYQFGRYTAPQLPLISPESMAKVKPINFSTGFMPTGMPTGQTALSQALRGGSE